jgi:hypothetical protein
LEDTSHLLTYSYYQLLCQFLSKYIFQRQLIIASSEPALINCKFILNLSKDDVKLSTSRSVNFACVRPGAKSYTVFLQWNCVGNEILSQKTYNFLTVAQQLTDLENSKSKISLPRNSFSKHCQTFTFWKAKYFLFL